MFGGGVVGAWWGVRLGHVEDRAMTACGASHGGCTTPTWCRGVAAHRHDLRQRPRQKFGVFPQNGGAAVGAAAACVYAPSAFLPAGSACDWLGAGPASL